MRIFHADGRVEHALVSGGSLSTIVKKYYGNAAKLPTRSEAAKAVVEPRPREASGRRREEGMRRFAILFAVLAPLAAQDFEPLFDGESIDGWVKRNGTASYEVVDGAIVGTTAEGSPNTFLSPPGEYGDFILEFETKVDPELNSGVQLRSHEYPQETTRWLYNRGWRERTFPADRVHGYQVEIANEASASSGGIYDEARRGWVDNIADPENGHWDGGACGRAFRDNEWNRYRVEARGVRIRTWINGTECADLVDPLDLSGFLGFQVHSYQGDSPKQARWRNIRIADLGRHAWEPIGSLEAWEFRGGGEVAIDDGLVSLTADKGEPIGFLVSDKTYHDATIRLEYRIESGNSGVFFRAVELGASDQRPLGFEVEVDPTRDIGGLQEPGGRGWIEHTPPEIHERLYRSGEWNEMVIHFRGGRIAVFANGYKTAELRGDPGRRSGKLALQVNSRLEDAEASFRNLEILAKQ